MQTYSFVSMYYPLSFDSDRYPGLKGLVNLERGQFTRDHIRMPWGLKNVAISPTVSQRVSTVRFALTRKRALSLEKAFSIG